MEILPGIHRIAVGRSNIDGLHPPNAYLVMGRRFAIIDTGYNRPDDIDTRAAYLNGLGEPEVEAIVITHRHIDHVGGASALHRKTKAPILAHADEKKYIDEQLESLSVHRTVADGDTLDLGGATLEFIHTPGHTLGSICVLVKETGVLFTGDNIMGFGTSVINPNEGDMALFIESMRKLKRYGLKTILPGHGNPVADPQGKIQELIDHRLERERQMLSYLEAGKRTVDDFLKEFYIKPGISAGLHDMARDQIRSHLIKLEREGKIEALDKDVYAVK